MHIRNVFMYIVLFQILEISAFVSYATHLYQSATSSFFTNNRVIYLCRKILLLINIRAEMYNNFISVALLLFVFDFQLTF